MLATSSLRLHKIVFNNPKVLEAFLPDDHAKGLQNLDFDDNSDLIHRSLGFSCDLKRYIFTFRVAFAQKPFMCRGALATVAYFSTLSVSPSRHSGEVHAT